MSSCPVLYNFNKVRQLQRLPMSTEFAVRILVVLNTH